MTIQYLKGDATNPTGDNNKVIVHICNDLGKWGKGFVLAISKRWSKPEQVYRDSFKIVLALRAAASALLQMLSHLLEPLGFSPSLTA